MIRVDDEGPEGAVEFRDAQKDEHGRLAIGQKVLRDGRVFRVVASKEVRTVVRKPARRKDSLESTEYRERYEKYIQSEAWRAKRAAYFAAGGSKYCQGCGDKTERHPHVHHRTYDRLGDEAFEDLVTVCKTCHALIHERHRLGDVSLSEATDLTLAAIRSSIDCGTWSEASRRKKSKKTFRKPVRERVSKTSPAARARKMPEPAKAIWPESKRVAAKHERRRCRDLEYARVRDGRRNYENELEAMR